MRSLISFLKITIFVILTLFVIPLQSIWVLFFKNTNHYYTLVQLYGKTTCLIFDIKINLVGKPEKHEKLVFVGNHISYIDIITLGSFIDATFIAKSEVAGWPLFGTLARISNTIFISRSREDAPQTINKIKAAIMGGSSLILFPEATSTPGKEVYPFKSTVFELFLSPDLKKDLVIQPFTISIMGVDGHEVQSDLDIDAYAWYGDMTLLPHLWALGKRESISLRITMHKSRPAREFSNRKEFAKICHSDVASAL